jgi:hypothetical protein
MNEYTKRHTEIPTVKENYFIKAKVIPVTDRGGPQGCETSRLPHFV